MQNFKLALHRCRQNKIKHQADQLALALLTDATKKSFWRKVKRISHNNLQTLPFPIDDAVGSAKIAEMWQDHYCHLLNVHKNNAKNTTFVD